MGLRRRYLNRRMVPVSFKFLRSESRIGKPKSPTTPKSCAPTNMLESVTTASYQSGADTEYLGIYILLNSAGLYAV